MSTANNRCSVASGSDSAALVGLPALAGSLVGVRLQQRISSRTITRLFAVFIVAVAVVFFLE